MATGTPAVHESDLLAAVPARHREGCLLVGHYGGGNYGDELLLELVQLRLRRAGVRRASFVYHAPERYPATHHDFGYRLVRTGHRLALVKALLRARSVIVGGGGLWGMDANANTVLLSLGIFVARRLLGKPVYLLGVGYYDSATHYGRLGARLAAWGSTAILARDEQTATNFRRLTARVHPGRDLALHIQESDLDGYRDEAAAIGAHLRTGDGTDRAVFVGLRRFRGDLGDAYWTCVQRLVADFPTRPFILATLEPPGIDTVNRSRAVDLSHLHANVSVFDFTCNPMALFGWVRAHADRLVMIAPQYHLLVSAELNGVPLYPMAYDDKVAQLLTAYGHHPVRSFAAPDYPDLRAFVDRAPPPGVTARPAQRVTDPETDRPVMTD